LAVLAVLYFGDIRGSLFIERDLLVFFVPPRQFWVEEVKNLIFPLWNPYYLNGHPLFATLQPGVLYPFSILYFILPFDWAFNLNIELHFALAGIFTYFLVRGMSGSQGAAIISAVAFMLSGYLISVHNLLSTLLSVIWVPLFFLCYFSAIKNNRLGHAILSGVVGVMMFLGGGIEVCYLTFAIAFLMTLIPQLVLVNDFIKIRRRLFFFAIFCAVFFGLSAVQLLPFLELSQLSIRSKGLTYQEVGTWSLHPFDLVELFLPDQYGVGTGFNNYWTYQNWLKTIYMGGIPFILGALFLRKWDRRAQGFLLLLFISLGLAMGQNTLFHHFLYEYLPFFNKLRFPVKFIFLAVLVLSVAAGLGYDYYKKELAERNSESQSWARYILIIGFFCMVVFGVLNIFNEPIIAHLKSVGWDQPEYNKTESNIFNFKRFLAFTSLFCVGMFLYSKPQFKKTAVLIVLIALFILDLFFAHFKFYNKLEYKKVQKLGENAKFIMSDPELFRTFVTPKTQKSKTKVKKDWQMLDILQERLTTGLLNNQRIFSTDGMTVTQQVRWDKLAELVKTAPAIDSTNLLNLMNVKYVVSTPPINTEGFKLVHATEPIPQNPKERKKWENSNVIKVYENKKMLPRAFLVPNCKTLSSEKEYKIIMEKKSFDPENILLLDAEPKKFPCKKQVGDVEEKGTVKVDSYKSNTIDLTVNSQSRQFLFLSDSYYPGWKVYVDGEEKEILRANYLFRALIVEPGKHRVHFEYDPLSFKLGLAISVTTILLCGAYFLRERNRRNSLKILVN
jgi:hypothetical protein